MRILTPAEVREVEKIRNLLVVGHGETETVWIDDFHGPVLNISLEDENKELWLNVLDMALQANEAMLLAWRRSSNVNLVEMVKQNE